jgi:hypothetical protein
LISDFQPISFPLLRLVDETTPLLQESLSSNTALLRLWACRDWSILAEHSSEQRSVIFSVSQPGNHPHNWNNIFSAIQPQCLYFISLLKGESKTAKTEKKEMPAPQSPAPYDTFSSPVRMRSMALTSPSKVSDSPSLPKSTLQCKIQSKMQEVGSIKNMLLKLH